MANKKVKPGDFVRRCLTSGTPVGAVCVIDDVEDAGIYAHHIPENTIGSFYIKHGEYHKMDSVRLTISNADARYLAERRPYAFKRSTTKTWEKACGKQDVVVLVAPNGMKFVLRNCIIWKQYSGREIAIRWETMLKVYENA